jgi:hypothetical protein
LHLLHLVSQRIFAGSGSPRGRRIVQTACHQCVRRRMV